MLMSLLRILLDLFSILPTRYVRFIRYVTDYFPMFFSLSHRLFQHLSNSTLGDRLHFAKRGSQFNSCCYNKSVIHFLSPSLHPSPPFLFPYITPSLLLLYPCFTPCLPLIFTPYSCFTQLYFCSCFDLLSINLLSLLLAYMYHPFIKDCT